MTNTFKTAKCYNLWSILLYISDTGVKVMQSLFIKKTWFAMWHLSNSSHNTYLDASYHFRIAIFLPLKANTASEISLIKFRGIWSSHQKSNLVILPTLKRDCSLKLSKYFWFTNKMKSLFPQATEREYMKARNNWIRSMLIFW